MPVRKAAPTGKTASAATTVSTGKTPSARKPVPAGKSGPARKSTSAPKIAIADRGSKSDRKSHKSNSNKSNSKAVKIAATVTGGGNAKKPGKPQSVPARAAKPAINPPRPAASAARPNLSARPGSTGTSNAAWASHMTPENGKPRKNQFSTRELEHFRDLLLAKRRELIGDMSSMEREALRTSGATNLSNLPLHMADMGTDNYEQEFTLGLVQKDRDLLKEINMALAKIQNGSYGVCEATSLPINKERLEFQPWVRFSVEHQRKMERHGR